MGLEMVDLTMQVEDRFRIEIPDHEASQFETVGQLYDYVRGKLRPVGSDKWSDERIWLTLQDIIVNQLGVPREAVVREAHFVRDFDAG
jgi:acyl carrier protein